MVITREVIERTYDVGVAGVIRNPGRFEGECAYAPYYYDVVQEGHGEEEHWDEPGEVSTIVDVTPEDVEQFPELVTYQAVRLVETDAGHVYVEPIR